MIKFRWSNQKAIIMLENVEENGWVIEFDDTDNTFLVWENSEHHAMGLEPNKNYRNLEEVLALIENYT
jgi:hypothetical protein